MRKLATLLGAAGVVLFAFANGSAQAAIINVPAPFATIQLAIDDPGTMDGDTIFIAAGIHTESNVNITKELTIEGAGTGLTFLEGGDVLFPMADNITIKNMTIRDSVIAIRFELAGSTIDNTLIDNVHMTGNSSRGIELHNATTVSNLTVSNSLFDNSNAVGLRMASTSTVINLSVTDSDFLNHSLGIYQANDGSTSTLDGLTVRNSTFANHTDTAIFAEEIKNAVIEDNTFTDNRRDFTIFKAYNNAGGGINVENIVVRNNISSGSVQSSILIFACCGNGLGLDGVLIEGNTINVDVNAMDSNFGKIDIRLSNGFAHAPLTIRNNTVTFSGAFA